MQVYQVPGHIHIVGQLVSFPQFETCGDALAYFINVMLLCMLLTIWIFVSLTAMFGFNRFKQLFGKEANDR